MRISPTRSLTYIQQYPQDVLITILNLLVPFTLIAVMISGDQMQSAPPAESLRTAWRLLDPLIHMTLGFLIITPFLFYHPATPKGILFAALLVISSVAADVDHILMAGSFTLQAITQVIPRTPFHSLSNALVVGLLVWLLTRKFSSTWLFFAVLMSHFVRDAYTGGMLLFPWSPGAFKITLSEYRSLEILLYLLTNLLIYSVTIRLPSAHGRWWRTPAAPKEPIQIPEVCRRPAK